MTSEDSLLLLLKTAGPLTAGALAERLAQTPQGLRRRLEAMAAQDLVEASPERAGVGRPRKLWRLGPAGEARFPDGHAQLATDLIRSIRQELGETTLDRLIGTREAEQRLRYQATLRPLPDLPSRLDALARLRSEEGYMAEVIRGEDGSLRLVEHHCPICAAATLCQGFCRSELAIFRTVLDAEVERETHILEGAPRCVYRVRERL